jgi:hypothetical protein
MSFQINRRKFLQALIAVGASYSVPVKATNAEIDNIWTQAQESPWYFEVNDQGTLVDLDGSEPQVWSDIFDSISTWQFETSTQVSNEVKACMPLAAFLNQELDNELCSLEEDLNTRKYCSPSERISLEKKFKALKEFQDEYEDPWMDWVELEGAEGVSKFKSLIDKWLNEPIDWSQSEWFPLRSGSQGRAFGFFQDQPYELLNALGIVVIEGEHPGSTYYAAELRDGLDYANESAKQLKLPFRFRQHEVHG